MGWPTSCLCFDFLVGTALLPVAALPGASTSCIVADSSVLDPANVTLVQCGANMWPLSYALLIFALTLEGIGFMTCLPMVHTFLSNVAYRDIQGLTQGTAGSLGSLLRAVGPMVTGVVFSHFAAQREPFWANVCLACGYFICFVASFWLSHDMVEVQRPMLAPRK